VRVTLVHNPKAGDRRIPDSDEIVAAIERLGWKVDPVDRDDIEKAVKDPGEMVLVAGGDGTIGKVAKRFAGTRVPIGVIPTGTANNVARTLGIGVDPLAAIDLLPRAVQRDVDLGVVTLGDAGTERFIEGIGVGVFAQLMGEGVSKRDKKLRRAFHLLAKEIAAYEPQRTKIEIDGRDVSGHYVLAAVMNLRSLGPALALAPDAKFDDGLLEVVLVRPEHTAPLVAHLQRAALEGDIALPAVEVHRARHVRLGEAGKWAHVDDCSREVTSDIEVSVEPHAVRFLLPPS
jgi:diacylglycerol kinase family enzyme